MNIKEYKTLYDLEKDYWWFKGRRHISFMLLEEHINKKDGGY